MGDILGYARVSTGDQGARHESAFYDGVDGSRSPAEADCLG